MYRITPRMKNTVGVTQVTFALLCFAKSLSDFTEYGLSHFFGEGIRNSSHSVSRKAAQQHAYKDQADDLNC